MKLNIIAIIKYINHLSFIIDAYLLGKRLGDYVYGGVAGQKTLVFDLFFRDMLENE